MCSDTTTQTCCKTLRSFHPYSVASRRISASSAILYAHTLGMVQPSLCTQSGRQHHSFHTCKHKLVSKLNDKTGPEHAVDFTWTVGNRHSFQKFWLLKEHYVSKEWSCKRHRLAHISAGVKLLKTTKISWLSSMCRCWESGTAPLLHRQTFLEGLTLIFLLT